MAIRYRMSWEGRRARWTKMVRGRRLKVTCAELNLPVGKWTKEGSHAAACAWLDQQLLAIVRGIEPEIEDALAEVDRRIDWSATHEPSEVPQLREFRKTLEGASVADGLPLPDSDQIDRRIQAARLFGITVPAGIDPIVLQDFFGDRRIVADRQSRHKKVAAEKTVGHALDRFLALQKLKGEPATHKEISSNLIRIPESVWSRETACSTVGETTVSAHYFWLANLELVASSHNKRLGFFRKFVTWLHQEKLIETLPRNLKSFEHRRKVEHQEVETFDGIDEFVSSLPEPQKSWAYVALNTGMTAADIGVLFWAGEGRKLNDKTTVLGARLRICGIVDPETWTLRRRRSKTGKNPKTPTVTYKLWPETIEALNRLDRTSPLVFLSGENEPLYFWRDGSKRDTISNVWDQRITFGKLRSVAADALYHEPTHYIYRKYFLAHAAGNMADRHYGREKDEPFFAATDYIRSKLFPDGETE